MVCLWQLLITCYYGWVIHKVGELWKAIKKPTAVDYFDYCESKLLSIGGCQILLDGCIKWQLTMYKIAVLFMIYTNSLDDVDIGLISNFSFLEGVNFYQRQ